MNLAWSWLRLGQNLQPRHILPVLLLALWPCGAGAQTSERLKTDISKCENIKNPDEAIAACSLLTSEGTFGPGNLAIAFANRGGAWGSKGDYDRAIADFDEALRLNPKFVDAYYNRGLVRAHMHDYNRAIADFDEALHLNPKLVKAYYNRALARTYARDLDRAITDFNEVIRLDPRHVDAYNNTAWLLATAPATTVRNGARAIELARKAAELTNWKEAHILQTLAAAYAETGNFSEAVRWQNKALEFPEFVVNSGPEAHRRVESYRQGQPVRATANP